MSKIANTTDLYQLFSRIIRRYNAKHLIKSIKISDFTKCVTSLERAKIHLVYNHVSVQPSNIHGNGVFATKDIPANKIVTFYPFQSFYITWNDELHTYKISDARDQFIENLDKYQNLYTWGSQSKFFGDYGITGDPEMSQDPMYIAHLVNDSVGNVFETFNFKELQSNPSLVKEITKKYEMMTREKANCEINSLDELPIVFLRTIKPIKKGDELLTSYGDSYWYGNSFFDQIQDDGNDLQSLLDK